MLTLVKTYFFPLYVTLGSRTGQPGAKDQLCPLPPLVDIIHRGTVMKSDRGEENEVTINAGSYLILRATLTFSAVPQIKRNIISGCLSDSQYL